MSGLGNFLKAAAPILTIASVGLTLVSAFRQASAANATADFAYQNVQFSSALAARNAAIIRQDAEFEVGRITREFKRHQAQTVAKLSASGVTLDTGSPLVVLGSNASEAFLETELVRRQAEIAVQNEQIKSQMSQRDSMVTATNAKTAASQAILGGFGKAGTTLLTFGAAGGFDSPPQIVGP